MIARLKKNFHLWGIDNDAVVDFDIIEQYCSLCEKIAHKLIIREWRPLVEDDKYSWQWNHTWLILAYNQPSPRGRLGERKRHISYDMLAYDFKIKGEKIFGLITHDGYEFKFLDTRRKFNEKLWNVRNSIHIYENGDGSRVLWAIKDHNGDIENNFLTKIKKIHETCIKNTFEIGCQVFWENEEKIVNMNGELQEFTPKSYDVNYLEKIFRYISAKHIDEFNQKSMFFYAKKEGDHILLIKKEQ